MTIAASTAGGAWSWHPHLWVWAVLAGVSALVSVLHRRLLRTSSHPEPWPRGRVQRFAGAMVTAGITMGWPLGDLAAHWSLSALVLQRCLLVLAVAPLLLAGLPDDVIRWLTRPASVDALLHPGTPTAGGRGHRHRGAGRLGVARPGVRPGQFGGRPWCPGSTGPVRRIILWLPIMGRIPGIPRPRPMIRAVYLVAQSVVPVFLSFLYILATKPLYPAYSKSIAVVHLRPLNDQQVAGFLSKLSFVFVLLTVAGVVLVRAPDTDDDLGPEDPLSWADVERHFERVDRHGHAMPSPDWRGRRGPTGCPPTPPATARPGRIGAGNRVTRTAGTGWSLGARGFRTMVG